MADFVIDASAAVPWCLEDEATAWSDSLLERVRNGGIIVVPAHWPTEIGNALLTAERKSRVDPGKLDAFWDRLELLGIEAQPALSAQQAKTVLAVSRRHRLTAYDAAYLELAKRNGLALASLDGDLRRAALAEDVVLL